MQAHESRRQTREQRIREREAQKILQEENLRKLHEDQEKVTTEEARLSERHLAAQMRKARRDLEKLKEKEYWLFDCEKCGLNGECIVRTTKHNLLALLTDHRMMANFRYSATKKMAAVCGNMQPATTYLQNGQKRTISNSYVLPVHEKGRPRKNPSLL